MDELMQGLCAKHGLTVISAMFHKNGSVNVWPHWNDEYGNDHCVSGQGRSFDAAFDRAMRQVEVLKANA